MVRYKPVKKRQLNTSHIERTHFKGTKDKPVVCEACGKVVYTNMKQYHLPHCKGYTRLEGESHVMAYLRHFNKEEYNMIKMFEQIYDSWYENILDSVVKNKFKEGYINSSGEGAIANKNYTNADALFKHKRAEADDKGLLEHKGLKKEAPEEFKKEYNKANIRRYNKVDKQKVFDSWFGTTEKVREINGIKQSVFEFYSLSVYFNPVESNVVVFDIDLYDDEGKKIYQELIAVLYSMKIPDSAIVATTSGNAYGHVTLNFAQAVPAKVLKEFAESVKSRLRIRGVTKKQVDSIEVMGFTNGDTIKIPFSTHHITGNKSYMIDKDGNEVEDVVYAITHKKPLDYNSISKWVPLGVKAKRAYKKILQEDNISEADFIFNLSSDYTVENAERLLREGVQGIGQRNSSLHIVAVYLNKCRKLKRHEAEIRLRTWIASKWDAEAKNHEVEGMLKTTLDSAYTNRYNLQGIPHYWLTKSQAELIYNLKFDTCKIPKGPNSIAPTDELYTKKACTSLLLHMINYKFVGNYNQYEIALSQFREYGVTGHKMDVKDVQLDLMYLLNAIHFDPKGKPRGYNAKDYEANKGFLPDFYYTFKYTLTGGLDDLMKEDGQPFVRIDLAYNKQTLYENFLASYELALEEEKSLKLS